MSVQTDRLGGARGSLAYKAPCRVATTGPITLSGLQTIDGVTLVSGDRVLVKDQTARADNGIYVATASAWERAKDCDGSGDAVRGTRVYVYDGDLGVADYELTTANPIVFGSSSIEWTLTTVQLSQSDTAARKLPVRVATEGNITLSGLQTFGTVTVVSGDRVLVWQQTNAVNNGIYVASSGAWSRAADCTDTGSLVTGTLVFVREGSYRGDFEVTSADVIDIGTDNITFNSLVVGADDEFDVILLMGQSNAAGSGTGGDWVDNDNLYVWNAGYTATGTAAVLATDRRTLAPFASDGSNNLGVHAADRYQRATGRRVLLVVMARGGTSITEMNDVGGIVYDPMITNMEALFTTYPNAQLVGFLWHQGEADQFETNAWYVTEFQTLLTNLRAQDWFPEDTPIIVGELYFGEYSASAQWRQTETLSYLPNVDHRIGCVSAAGLDAVDEGFTDSGGAPYRVHFTGPHLRLLGQRYGGALLAMINGTYSSPRFSVPERLGYKNPGPAVEIINVSTSSPTLTLTIPQIIQQPVIKCAGDATITLPNISSMSVSSWRRALTYRFTIFCNTNSNTITITSGSTYTVSYGNVTPSTTVTIANTRAPVDFFYAQDGRWRGIRSVSS